MSILVIVIMHANTAIKFYNCDLCPSRVTAVSDADGALLSLELEKLREAGFGWEDPYTQCILQNTVDAIQYE